MKIFSFIELHIVTQLLCTLLTENKTYFESGSENDLEDSGDDYIPSDHSNESESGCENNQHISTGSQGKKRQKKNQHQTDRVSDSNQENSSKNICN